MVADYSQPLAARQGNLPKPHPAADWDAPDSPEASAPPERPSDSEEKPARPPPGPTCESEDWPAPTREEPNTRSAIPASITKITDEVLLGLAHAIRTFDTNFERKFFDYAVMCIRNSLVRALRGANRKKQQVLNQAGEMTEFTPVPTVSGVDEVVLGRRGLQEIQVLAKKLSPLEIDVLRKRLAGEGAEEMAAQLNLTVKKPSPCW